MKGRFYIVKFKKINYLLVFLLALMGCICFAKDSNDLSINTSIQDVSSEKEISRGKIFTIDDLNIFCYEKIKIFPEVVSTVQDKNDSIYTKTVEVSKEFKINKENKEVAKFATCTSKIKFTYDKHSFVKIKNITEDVQGEKSGENWSIMDVREVFSKDDICTVSTRCALYKETFLGTLEYVLSGHFDVCCSLKGEIGINTDFH